MSRVVGVGKITSAAGPRGRGVYDARMRTRLAAVSSAAVLMLSLSACGEDDAAPDAAGPDTTAAAPSCDYEPNDRAVVDGIELPPAEPTVEGDVPVTLDTSVGDLALTLTADATPCTVGSFVSLAEQGYFDGTSCHRLTDWGVLQCGDPSGTGSGGPGYSFADELTGDETYPAGTLAMANAGADTNGSQFFVLYMDTGLPAAYTVFGNIDEATAQTITDVAAAGSTPPSDGTPNKEVRIESVTISD